MDIGAVPRRVVDLLLGGSAGDLADETHLVPGGVPPLELWSAVEDKDYNKVQYRETVTCMMAVRKD